jgi:hypothetical protein
MGHKIIMAVLAVLVMPEGPEEFLTPITDILDFLDVTELISETLFATSSFLLVTKVNPLSVDSLAGVIIWEVTELIASA